MSEPTYDVPVAIEVDQAQVRRLVSLLRVVVDAETQQEAEDGMEEFLSESAGFVKNTEAAFAAAQLLRDLDVIEPAEAAYIFNKLHGRYEFARDAQEAKGEQQSGDDENPVYYVEFDDDLHVDVVVESRAAWSRRSTESIVAYHRLRGEVALAEMILNDGEEYNLWCIEGKWTLLDCRPSSKVMPFESWAPADPMEVAIIRDRIMTMAVTETLAEAHAEWSPLRSVSMKVNVRSAVAAAQELRRSGQIAPGEATALISRFATTVAIRAMDADRQYARLTRRMEAIEARVLDDADDFITSDDYPAEWQALNAERERRARRIKATCLRRLGEHEMANAEVEAAAVRVEDC